MGERQREGRKFFCHDLQVGARLCDGGAARGAQRDEHHARCRAAGLADDGAARARGGARVPWRAVRAGNRTVLAPNRRLSHVARLRCATVASSAKLYKDPITECRLSAGVSGSDWRRLARTGCAGTTAAGSRGRGRRAGRSVSQQTVRWARAADTADGRASSSRCGRPRMGAAPVRANGQASPPAAGPIIGVSSRSTAQSLRLYNGRGHYNEWLFVSTAATRNAGARRGTADTAAWTSRPRRPRRCSRGAWSRDRASHRMDSIEAGPSRGTPTPPAARTRRCRLADQTRSRRFGGGQGESNGSQPQSHRSPELDVHTVTFMTLAQALPIQRRHHSIVQGRTHLLDCVVRS